MMDMSSYKPGDTCSSCKFYHIDPRKVNEGECRINPPAVNLVAAPRGVQILGSFPPIGGIGWCGKHSKKISA